MKKQWLVLFLFAFVCCMHSTEKKVTVGSKNFSEQVILGELIAQQIEGATDVEVIRKLNLGGTFICHEAMISGAIDIYAEYTGTAFTAILKQETKTDPKVVLNAVKEAYKSKFNLEWLEPFGFNNTFAILIRGEDARKLQIQKLSEARQYAPQWIAGFGYEFMERKDGFPGLAATYNLQFRETPKVMDLTLTYRALAEKKVDLIAGDSTSGLIAKLDLFQLQDDKNYFPPYHAAAVARTSALERYPEVRAAINQLAGRISEKEMQRMNFRVDAEHADVKKVVAEFLAGLK